MKKIFMAPTASLMSVEMESAILGASAIVSGGQAQPGTEQGGGVPGGNGGDGNARQAAGTTQPKVTANISAYELN